MTNAVVIVEGKNDMNKLRGVLSSDIEILCTFGSLSSERMYLLQKKSGNKQVYLFMDNDVSGKKIRGMLRDLFPDSEQIYTRKGYAGVEGTPEEYIIQQLEKAGLEEFILYPAHNLINFELDKSQKLL